jgi:hypothetical protein
LSGGPWARGFILRVFLGSFEFVFYEGKWVFPGCLRDPYGCLRQLETLYSKKFERFRVELPESFQTLAGSRRPITAEFLEFQ